MKPGKYDVYLLLERDAGDFAKIVLATCDCAAGYVINLTSIHVDWEIVFGKLLNFRFK